MAIFLGIFMIDNLLNAMINPVYILFSGSLISMLLLKADGNRTPLKTRFIPSPGMNPSRFIG